jgi:hypothetical protein
MQPVEELHVAGCLSESETAVEYVTRAAALAGDQEGKGAKATKARSVVR